MEGSLPVPLSPSNPKIPTGGGAVDAPGLGFRISDLGSKVQVPIEFFLTSVPIDLFVAYRGTSPIRKRPTPQDPPRTLGMGLR